MAAEKTAHHHQPMDRYTGKIEQHFMEDNPPEGMLYANLLLTSPHFTREPAVTLEMLKREYNNKIKTQVAEEKSLAEIRALHGVEEDRFNRAVYKQIYNIPAWKGEQCQKEFSETYQEDDIDHVPVKRRVRFRRFIPEEGKYRLECADLLDVNAYLTAQGVTSEGMRTKESYGKLKTIQWPLPGGEFSDDDLVYLRNREKQYIASLAANSEEKKQLSLMKQSMAALEEKRKEEKMNEDIAMAQELESEQLARQLQGAAPAERNRNDVNDANDLELVLALSRSLLAQPVVLRARMPPHRGPAPAAASASAAVRRNDVDIKQPEPTQAELDARWNEMDASDADNDWDANEHTTGGRSIPHTTTPRFIFRKF